jgi:hypothetical protein
VSLRRLSFKMLIELSLVFFDSRASAVESESVRMAMFLQLGAAWIRCSTAKLIAVTSC